MVPRSSRFLLAFSSFLLVVGAVMHAVAFRMTLTAVAKSDIPAFFGNSLKALWLGDSATLLIVAVLFCLFAIRPSTATRLVVLLVSLVPAATAVLLYIFLGNFFAGHLLIVTSAVAFLAGLKFPGAGD